MINKIENTKQDVMVKFMHLHSPFIKLFWPSREDECWVPITEIICTIDAPAITNGYRMMCDKPFFDIIKATWFPEHLNQVYKKLHKNF